MKQLEIENNIITFKSIPTFFLKEKSGIKNNTVRILTEKEYSQIERLFETNYPFPTFIGIKESDSGEVFYREILDFSDFVNKDSIIGIFTWCLSKPTCCSKCGKPVTPDIQIEYSKDVYGKPICMCCEE